MLSSHSNRKPSFPFRSVPTTILKHPTQFLNSSSSEFAYDPNNETDLVKELILQVRKVIGPFAAPKKIYIVSDLPKTRSGKVCFASDVSFAM
jgi:acyl-CoA synthetase (AMP-forming)/AMP-acid ligase II